jgi:hypothetical protein
MSDLLAWSLIVVLSVALPNVVSWALLRRDRRRRMVERAARLERQEASWRLWCEMAGRCTREGLPVPTWRSPE